MKVLLIIAGMLALCSGVMAQERAAGSALDTQMTWSALSAQAKAASDKADAVNSRVDQVVTCGKKGMVYAPGVAGRDVEGCVEAGKAGDISTNISSIVNALNTNTTNVNTLTSTVNNVVNCNKAGGTYNGTACVTNTAPSCKLDVVVSRGKSYQGGGVAMGGSGSCPAGYTRLSSQTRQVGGSCSSCGSATATDVTCGKVICQ